MPIIKPRGLLGGERLGELSMQALLYWPFLYAGSNGYGRFRLSYKQIIAKCFQLPQFVDNPPSKETISALLKEYREKHLLFAYVANGEAWGAWDSAASQTFYSVEDKKSPAAPEPAFSEWRAEYERKKTARSRSDNDVVDPESLPDFSVTDITSESNRYQLSSESLLVSVSKTSVSETSISESQNTEIKKLEADLSEISDALASVPAANEPITIERLKTAKEAGVTLTRTLMQLLGNDRLWFGWEEFWREYPSQTGWADAFDSWWKLAQLGEISTANVDEVIAGLKRYKRSEKWARDDGRWICGAKVFLIGDDKERRGRMWKDHPPESMQSKSERRAERKSATGTDPHAEWEPEWKKKPMPERKGA